MPPQEKRKKSKQIICSKSLVNRNRQKKLKISTTLVNPWWLWKIFKMGQFETPPPCLTGLIASFHLQDSNSYIHNPETINKIKSLTICCFKIVFLSLLTLAYFTLLFETLLKFLQQIIKQLCLLLLARWCKCSNLLRQHIKETNVGDTEQVIDKLILTPSKCPRHGRARWKTKNNIQI